MATRPNNRKLSLPQAKRRLKSLALEMAAIGGAWDQSAGELRRRVLGAWGTLQEIIARFPTPPE